jgi:hypothetical protein
VVCAVTTLEKHFKDQRALIVRRRGKVIELKGLRSVEGFTIWVLRRESHRSDTDSRLLTDEPRDVPDHPRQAVY